MKSVVSIPIGLIIAIVGAIILVFVAGNFFGLALSGTEYTKLTTQVREIANKINLICDGATTIAQQAIDMPGEPNKWWIEVKKSSVVLKDKGKPVFTQGLVPSCLQIKFKPHPFNLISFCKGRLILEKIGDTLEFSLDVESGCQEVCECNVDNTACKKIPCTGCVSCGEGLCINGEWVTNLDIQRSGACCDIVDCPEHKCVKVLDYAPGAYVYQCHWNPSSCWYNECKYETQLEPPVQCPSATCETDDECEVLRQECERKCHADGCY